MAVTAARPNNVRPSISFSPTAALYPPIAVAIAATAKMPVVSDWKAKWAGSNPLLLGSYYNESLGRHQNSAITDLKPTHEDFDLVPDRVTLAVAHLLKNWSHLWKAIASVLHGCGKRRKPLFAGYDFNDHITEAGLLKGATKHLGIAQREHAGVLERCRR